MSTDQDSVGASSISSRRRKSKRIISSSSAANTPPKGTNENRKIHDMKFNNLQHGLKPTRSSSDSLNEASLHQKNSGKLRKKPAFGLKRTLSNLSISSSKPTSNNNDRISNISQNTKNNGHDHHYSHEQDSSTDNKPALRKNSFAENLLKRFSTTANSFNNKVGIHNPVIFEKNDSTDDQSITDQLENASSNIFRKITNVVHPLHEHHEDLSNVSPLMKSSNPNFSDNNDNSTYNYHQANNNNLHKVKVGEKVNLTQQHKSTSDHTNAKYTGRLPSEQISRNDYEDNNRRNSIKSNLQSSVKSYSNGNKLVGNQNDDYEDKISPSYSKANQTIMITPCISTVSEKDGNMTPLNKEFSHSQFWSDVTSNALRPINSNTLIYETPVEEKSTTKNSSNTPKTNSPKIQQQWIAPESWDVEASINAAKSKKNSLNRGAPLSSGSAKLISSNLSSSKLSATMNSRSTLPTQKNQLLTPPQKLSDLTQESGSPSSIRKSDDESCQFDDKSRFSDKSSYSFDEQLNYSNEDGEDDDSDTSDDSENVVGLKFSSNSASNILLDRQMNSKSQITNNDGDQQLITPSAGMNDEQLSGSHLSLDNYISLEDERRDKAEYELEKYYKDTSDLDPTRKYLICIFNTDDTFTTLNCTPGTTVQEMIPTLRKKFNISSHGNFQISLRIGKSSKILKPLSKPILIERKLLLLIGYMKSDSLHTINSKDLVFVFKFHFHPVAPSHLSAEQEQKLLRSDFVHVDLRRLDLTTPPIIFYQHTAEIESLDVSNNANIFLPLEFIESAFNLSSLRMVNIRASKFPANITEAYKLVTLELQRNLIRRVPSSIANLTNLTILNLQCNNLEKLPNSFHKLKNLQILDLSSNYFMNYPEVVNECTNLLQMDLSYNKISKLPTSTNQLVKLAKLNLSHNKLTLIGDLSGMKCLRTLNLRHNRITSLKTNAANLQNIFLTDNRISTFDDTLSKLRALEIQENPITSIPYKDFYPWNMTSLSLNKAKLSSIPGKLFLKLSRLEKLDLNENNLTELPMEISKLSKLIYLSAARNKLEGLPSNFNELKCLRSLDLHYNNIRDFVEGSEDLELTYLNISSNAFGSINANSQFHQNFTKDSKLGKTLIFFIVADNHFDDSTWQMFNCFQKLKVLNLSYNKFSDITNFDLRNLTELYFSGNKISTLPSETVMKWKSLKTLMLNNNQLTSLPAELSQLEQLTVFDVGSNQLKYNISNFHYDWNWRSNKELRYLNFSNNKRFEIKSYMNQEVNADLSDLTVLPNLKILGLMDVTINTSKVPDENVDFRLRTTASSINGRLYGVADTLGQRDYLASRDVTFERFRGKDDECLICLHDSKNQSSADYGHNISQIVRDTYDYILKHQLEKYCSDDDDDEKIKMALRHSFLELNKEVNNKLSAVDHGVKVDNLSSADLLSGACSTVIYIKGEKVFTANIGDCQAIFSESNGNYKLLTKLHVPYKRAEYERIRISGGYVNNDKLDGGVDVSRAVGFYDLLPHIHASPDISVSTITSTDDMLVLATHRLWDYMDFETVCDITRENIGNPMLAAGELKDHAIAYGCLENLTILCLSLQKADRNAGNFDLNKSLLMTKKSHFGDVRLRKLSDEVEPPTGNVAIVFTDIKSSTFFWELFPNAMRTAIKTHNDVMRRLLRIYQGYEVKTEGDSFMVAFNSPISALVWCLSVQLKLLDAEWPEEIISVQGGSLVTDKKGTVIFQGLSVRMGIHWGCPLTERDPTTERMDYLGPVVNKAARVSNVADGGQVALSNDFIAEFNKIMVFHEKVTEEKQALKDEYPIDEIVEKELENQLSLLENIGWKFFDYGEKKLKGLETKEFITIAYPEILSSRHELLANDDDSAGAISSDILFKFRTVSNKLDSILSAVSGGVISVENADKADGFLVLNPVAQEAISTSITEFEMMTFFDHLITRIESTISLLYLRQKVMNRLDIQSVTDAPQKSIFEILDSLFDKP